MAQRLLRDSAAMTIPRRAVALLFVTAALLLAGTSHHAQACAIFDFYYTEVTESDAPDCLTVSGHQREEEAPRITVKNRCEDPATISWLPAGSSTPTQHTVAIGADKDITFPRVDDKEVLHELFWDVGADTGRLNVRAWNEPEACPDTGVECAMRPRRSSSGTPEAIVGLLVAGLLVFRRQRRSAR